MVETKAGESNNRDARLELQQTLDLGLDGKHFIGKVKMDWGANYSRATEERPNERYASYQIKGKKMGADFEGFGTDFADIGLRQPYYTKTIPTLDNDGWDMKEITNSNSNITKNEFKGKLNFSIPLMDGLYGNQLKIGGKYTNKHKTYDKHKYEYDTEEVLGNDWRDLTTSQIREGFMPGEQYQTGVPFISKTVLGDIDFSKYEGEELLEEAAGNYDIHESVTAGFLRFDQKLGKDWSATVGLRIEHTQLKTSGYNLVADAEEPALDPTGDYKHDYTDLLPSLLVKYRFNEDGNLRASVTRTLARPKYSTLIANKTFNLYDGVPSATIGNPDLKPARAWNFDLSADYYFKSVGLVSVGLFYKNIKGMNISCTSTNYTGADLGLTNEYTTQRFNVEQTINAYDAKILGMEVAYQRDFGFIAPALKCIGFYGNYTYTHSSTSNYHELLNVKEGDDVTAAGSPDHTANASLYIDKAGFNLRISYNFASSFLDEMGDIRALDRYYDKVNYLDINASYSWGKKTRFTVYADATNLLNQPLRYYLSEKERTAQVEYYGVKVKAGIKVNL